ncbi:hypothetical protein F4824DRAFT_301531 [Ustulina deusta]|nr:hypothetical protein F4824DRAFT_301531 [Ustulina deusta]
MMFLTFLAAFVAIAAAHAGLLPVVGEVGIVTTTPAYHPWSISIPTFLEATLTSFSSRLTKRQYDAVNKSYQHREDALLTSTVIILVIVCLLLAFIVISLIVWVLWCTCLRQWYQRRCSRLNPERERAEQLLNSPRHPIDIELGIIHARSPPQWPLTDDMNIPTTTPNNYGTENGYMHTGTSSMHSNRTLTPISEASSLGVMVEGVDITDIAIPERFITDTEMMQAFEPNTDHSNDDLNIPHAPSGELDVETGADNQIHASTAYEDTWSNATDVSDLESVSTASAVCGSETHSNHSESSSLNSHTFEALNQADVVHETEALDIYAQNGIIQKDWAYHTA